MKLRQLLTRRRPEHVDRRRTDRRLADRRAQDLVRRALDDADVSLRQQLRQELEHLAHVLNDPADA